MWWDSDSGRAYVYYNDTDSSQWVEMNPSWNGSVADGSVTPPKLSTGGPDWDTSGNLTVDGNITAAGNITSQGVFQGDYDGNYLPLGTVSNSAFLRGNQVIFTNETGTTMYGRFNTSGNFYVGPTATPAISLNADGGITAAGMITSKNRININNTTANTSDVIWATNTGSSLVTTQRFKADGSIQLGDVNGSADTANIELNADGSASFAGEVNLGGTTTSAGGVQIREVGSIASRRDGPTVFGVYTVYNGGNETTDQVISFKNNGSAEFAGNITAGNVSFNLEADDDTKYTATTDADGNETRVYNGAVLDVKERLQNTQAVLYRIKAALIQPDADANQLRLRLLEALDVLTLDGEEE